MTESPPFQTGIDPRSIRIVDLLLHDLCGRKGLGNEWEEIDNDTQIEIEETWQKIVSDVLNV